jgi:terminase, large subunit
VSTPSASIAGLIRDARLAWRPAPRLSLSGWADRTFRLPAGDANAGRWTTLPYQRGIMDAISDPEIERVTVMKSARVGYTRIFSAAVGFFIEHDPCPIMIVQPTIDDARRHSKEDLAPVFAEIPELRDRIAEPRAKDSDNTILVKLFRGGSLSLIGANSARGFRGVSRRVVIFDEVDGYPASAGTEGDQLELGIKRTEYYWNRKILVGSTPTLTGHSRIERLFESGDQRRYHVPCPTCGALHVLRFGNLKWPDGKPESAVFVCPVKGCTIEPAHKAAMIAAGEWIAERPEHYALPSGRGHASFHVWAAYSSSPNAAWGHLAAEFVKAVAGGPTTHRTFVNTTLGETWRESGEAPAWEPLLARREPYPFGTCPAGVRFLTAGVDVQKDRLCYEVVGWGRGKSSWSIEYVTVPGDTSDLTPAGPWGKLDAVLGREYPHASGHPLRIEIMAVDSGWNAHAVYAWSRRHPTSRVLVVKGQAHGTALIGAPAPVDVTVRGRKLKRGARVWPVNGAIAKSELYGALRLDDATALGYCHFPGYGDDYFRELTAEQLLTVITRRGFIRLEWAVLPGRRNEALDARVYARAAASLYGLDRFTPLDWDAFDAGLGASPEPESFDDERPE